MQIETSKLNGKEPPTLSSRGRRRSPCPACESKTACETYPDGHRYCHKCKQHFPPPHAPSTKKHLSKTDAKLTKKASIKDLKRKWNRAAPVNSEADGYPLDKQIAGIKYRQHDERTLISRVRSVDGKLQGLQTTKIIKGGRVKKSDKHPDGRLPDKYIKRFVAGTVAKGGMEFFGKFDDPDEIIVTEGLATAESIYDSTGHKRPVVCAYSAGNVPEVVWLLHVKYPQAEFILAIDQDEAGEKAVEGTLIAVPGIALKVASPKFKSPRKGRNDFNDLMCLRGRKAIRRRIKQAMRVELLPLARILSARDVCNLKLPPIEDIAHPILQFPGITLFGGAFGAGKTFVGMKLAVAINAALDCYNWTCDKARSVLFMDFELPTATLQERLGSVINTFPEASKLDLSNLFIWSASDCYPVSKPNLADRTQIAALVDQCNAYDVVILDNVSASTSGVDPNLAESYEPIQDFAMQRRHAGKSTVLIQHFGKDKSRGPRGSSRQEDYVDVSLALDKTINAAGNAAIKVTCRKMRNHPESAFVPIEIELGNFDGEFSMEYRPQVEAKSERIADEYKQLLEGNLIRRGTQKELVDKYGVDKSVVSRMAQRVTKQYRKEKDSARRDLI